MLNNQSLTKFLSNCNGYIYCVELSGGYCKVGYGSVERLTSSDYWTAQHKNCRVKIFVIKGKTIKELYRIEQNFHNHILPEKHNLARGDAGREVYKVKFKEIVEIITNQLTEDKHEFDCEDTKISVVREVFSKNSQWFNVPVIRIGSPIRVNPYECKSKCCRMCNRSCSIIMYQCTFINPETNQIENDNFGPSCAEKLLEDYTSLYHNKIVEDKYCDDEEETKQDGAVSKCIKQYYKNPMLTLNKEEYVSHIEELCIENMSVLLYRIITWIILEFYNKKEEITDEQLTNIRISSEELKEWKSLFKINISLLYGILKQYPCSFVELHSEEIADNEFKFDIELNHPDFNPQELVDYFCQYTNEQTFSDEIIIKVTRTKFTTVHQLNAINSNKLIISGPAGTGKSYVLVILISLLEYIRHKYSKILIISPTYKAIENIKEKISENLGDDITSLINFEVVSSLFSPFKKYKDIDVTLFDECFMANFLHMITIKNFVETIKPYIVRFFGDPYQCPPINFTGLSVKILGNIIQENTVEITRPFRTEGIKDEKIREWTYWVVDNKKNYKNIKNIKDNLPVGSSTFEQYDNNTDKIAELIATNENGVGCAIVGTNNTRNRINTKVYQKCQKQTCPDCANNIAIPLAKVDIECCSNCIGNIPFIMDVNQPYDNKDELCSEDSSDSLEPIKTEKKYHNILHKNTQTGEIYSFPNNNNDKYQLTNSQTFNIKRVEIDNNEYFEVCPQNGDPSLFTFKQLKSMDFSLAYALTTHKAQGSEYKNIVLVIENNMNSNILYTAFTRLKTPTHVYVFYKIDIHKTINPNVYNSEPEEYIEPDSNTCYIPCEGSRIKRDYDIALPANRYDGKRWSRFEIKWVVEHHDKNKYSMKAIAKWLGRTESACQMRYDKLKQS